MRNSGILSSVLILAASLALSGCVSHSDPAGRHPTGETSGKKTQPTQQTQQTTADTGGMTAEERRRAAIKKLGPEYYEYGVDPKTPDSPARRLLIKGNEFLKAKKYDAAIAEYDKAIKLEPRNQMLYVQKGQALAGKGLPLLAVPLYDKAIALNTRTKVWTWWPLQLKGDALSKANQYDRSAAVFTKAIALNPSAELYARRGNAYAEIQDVDKSLADYKRATDESPQWAYAWKMQSVLYAMIAQRDRNEGAAIKACQASAKACKLGDCESEQKFKSTCARYR